MLPAVGGDGIERALRARHAHVALLLGTLACGDAPATPVVQPEPAFPFEVPEGATTWLNETLHPFSGTDLSLDHDDLEALREMVGDARVVALGENTHGTRDFFEMKARILRFLVEEMGFEAFMIEATWPESNRLDRYVLTGDGDPEVLLTGLYFWTWRTESVLEMIEWMRAHNAGGGHVRFLGFDMQFPGMALHNAIQFVGMVEPDSVGATQSRLQCLNAFANDPRGLFPDTTYAEAGGPPYWAACQDSIQAEAARFDANRDAYVAASSAGEFAIARQSLRVAEQYHEMVTQEQSRDESMAENTIWWMDQLGPDSKAVLWAHNFHVSDQLGSQGRWLRDAYGDDLVVALFSHESGSYTGVTTQNGQVVAFGRLSLSMVEAESHEFYLSTADSARFLLDLRQVSVQSEGAFLFSNRLFRSIGCCYDPGRPRSYWFPTELTDVADVLIHFRQTGATTLIPARWPRDFAGGS